MSKQNDDDWLEIVPDQEREHIMREYLSYTAGLDPS